MIGVLDAAQLTGRARTHLVDLAGEGGMLHPAAAGAYLALKAAAARDGIGLRALSAFRDFERQLLLWNEKFSGQRPVLDRDARPLDLSQMSDEQIVRAILHWSALPGASRHHWGTEIDVIDGRTPSSGGSDRLLPGDFAPGGPYARLDRWLGEHAGRFGFFRPYDADRGGVQPEPWHLSYAPVADRALRALTPALLADTLSGVHIEGSAVIARELATIHARYVCAIAPPGVALGAPAIPLQDAQSFSQAFLK
jgi:LAS superfamily LD-carboxypeptidase LdcB